jgi:hypothetical protein
VTTLPGSPRRRLAGLALALLLLPIAAAGAETFLVVVMETLDGEVGPPPHAAREGILAALFDGDQIGFEFPAGEPLPSTDRLRGLAVEAGATTLAVLVVDWHVEPQVGGAWRVGARGNLVLTDAQSGRSSPSIPIEVQKVGSEPAVERYALGLEIGSLLIEAYRAWSVGH